MNITEKITVTISPDELKQMLIDKLLTQNIKVNNIEFNINPHNRVGDYLSEYGSIYTLDNIILTGNKI